MATLVVGSGQLKKGIEYNGLVPYGNAFRTTEQVRVSINRTPFAVLPAHEDIYALGSFTYSFEEDTVLLFTRLVQSDLTIVWNSRCPQSVDLVKNTESAIICEVEIYEKTKTGTIECVSEIENDSDSNADYTIRISSGGTVLGTSALIRVDKKTTANVYFKYEIAAELQANSKVSFTLEVNQANNRVNGGANPSQIQVKRIT